MLSTKNIILHIEWKVKSFFEIIMFTFLCRKQFKICEKQKNDFFFVFAIDFFCFLWYS